MKTLIEGKNFKLRRKKKDQQWADDVSNLDIQRNNIGKIKTSERRSTTEMFFLQERIQTENKKEEYKKKFDILEKIMTNSAIIFKQHLRKFNFNHE